MNWGSIVGWTGAFLSLGSSIGYFYVKDYRRGFYFLFGFAITICIVWPGGKQ